MNKKYKVLIILIFLLVVSAIQKMFIEKWDGKLPVYSETPKIYKNIIE